jgi:hypothetical protein
VHHPSAERVQLRLRTAHPPHSEAQADYSVGGRRCVRKFDRQATARAQDWPGTSNAILAGPVNTGRDELPCCRWSRHWSRGPRETAAQAHNGLGG